jgi:nucleoid-associated protein YgaU
MPVRSFGTRFAFCPPVALSVQTRSRGRPETYFLAVALLLPLVVAALLLSMIPATGLASSAGAPPAEASARLLGKRPAPSDAAPPPTLAPPAATATPPAASPTPRPTDSYVVQPGDELKQIAAEHHLSLAQIIAANDIPNPDSLRVGQVLHIPAH